ncbi:T6SS phospholipase effector Tle1-like catalytic domain-containing protein [Aspergillus affinis]|uniref:T6SS phospholipase effector Tle1-like catalytic domain-containing protein n=1 Tax=Aspergillus affinis TaxID=1070780 RepID=UPI0022FEEB90|nr:uncharacterized protein KD926_006025 [Aspergillus affinis]KAI9046078.1 hypothetical protein KD926_006025 [Aspergillus affinis]
MPTLSENSSTSSNDLRSTQNSDDDSDTAEFYQDVQEVWFPGCHSDIGGGWKRSRGERWRLSHGPLVWMVQEAERACLQLDSRKMKKSECTEKFDENFSLYDDSDHDTNHPSVPVNQRHSSQQPASASSTAFHEALRFSAAHGIIHDRLDSRHGFSFSSVLSWRLMEYLRLSWMALQPNSSWKKVNWLHRGAARDITTESQIHPSAIQRMASDPTYRPENLILDRGRKRKKEMAENARRKCEKKLVFRNGRSVKIRMTPYERHISIVAIDRWYNHANG